MRAEWRKAPEFHEIAEAVGVETDCILSAMDPTGKNQCWLIYYTYAEETLLWQAELIRDADGILVLFGEPQPKPGMWEAIKAKIEEELE